VWRSCLARYFHEVEGRSIAQIADRFGRSRTTGSAYFYDLTGDKAKRSMPVTSGRAEVAAPTCSRANAKSDANAY
jgi:hypothetical protein